MVTGDPISWGALALACWPLWAALAVMGAVWWLDL